MPRGPRNLDPHGGTYHVTTRGNNKRQIFFDVRDCLIYLAIIKRCKLLFPFDLYHYCLMSNHVHLCIKTSKKHSLSIIMKFLNQRYAQAFNKRHGQSGHLWQGPYHKVDIRTDRQLLTTALYIEKNPYKARMVDEPADYRWSSYRHYAFGEHNELITDNPLYADLGTNDLERQHTYTNYMRSRLLEFERISPIEAEKSKVIS